MGPAAGSAEPEADETKGAMGRKGKGGSKGKAAKTSSSLPANMADAAPMTPTSDNENQPEMEKETEAPLDPMEAAEAEASAWRELREAFGEQADGGLGHEEQAEGLEEWPEEEEEATAHSPMPKQQALVRPSK